MLPDPLEVLAPLARVGQIRVRPPPLPKFLTPYAYVYLKTNLQCPFPKSEKEEYTSILS